MGRPRTHDYEAVLAAWAAGERAPTIAARIGTTASAVTSIVSRARRAGHANAVPRGPGRPRAAEREIVASLASEPLTLAGCARGGTRTASRGNA